MEKLNKATASHIEFFYWRWSVPADMKAPRLVCKRVKGDLPTDAPAACKQPDPTPLEAYLDNFNKHHDQAA